MASLLKEVLDMDIANMDRTKSMASQGIPGASRWAHLRDSTTKTGGLSDDLKPRKPTGPALQIAASYSAGQKRPRTDAAHGQD
jgi:hypothetical protein